MKYLDSSAPNIEINDIEINTKSSAELSSLIDLHINRFLKLSQLLKTNSCVAITPLEMLNFDAKENNITFSIIVRINLINEKLESYVINCEDYSIAKNIIIQKNQISEAVIKKLKILVEGIVVQFIFNPKFILEDLIFPGDFDLKEINNNIKISTNSKFAIMSDIHIGSKLFRKNDFKKALSFIANSKDIKYVIIAGDFCDGAGVYPGHEYHLDILSIHDQYKKAAELLQIIPDDKTIIFSPGNHDASPLFQPQRKLESVYASLFKKNVICVSNPVEIRLEGRLILVYHGASLDGIIANIESFDYEDASKPMQYMLKIRHLAPKLGRSAITSWYNLDYLVIQKLPWAFITGHIHTFTNTRLQNGTILINSGTWQDLSDFQARLGHKPTYCKLTICSLADGALVTKDFYGEDN